MGSDDEVSSRSAWAPSFEGIRPHGVCFHSDTTPNAVGAAVAGPSLRSFRSLSPGTWRGMPASRPEHEGHGERSLRLFTPIGNVPYSSGGNGIGQVFPHGLEAMAEEKRYVFRQDTPALTPTMHPPFHPPFTRR